MRMLRNLHLCALENYVDGKDFGELTEEEIKTIVPPIGLRRKILRLQPKVSTIDY